MKKHTKTFESISKALAILLCTLLAASALSACSKPKYHATDNAFSYSAAPARNNPLRGAAIWISDTAPEFPCSLEYIPLPLNMLFSGESVDFSYSDTRLNRVASRGNNAIIRLLLWEGNDNYLPDHYRAAGATEVTLSDTNTTTVPDFSSDALINLLSDFIASFGTYYDGDPRIGFVQLGLMGRWGEWNYGSDYPAQNIPTTEQYNAIYKAYDDAFSTTKLMARNPNLGTPRDYNIGYHDDNFAYNTIGTGGGDFSYLYERGEESADKYKRECFGAELSGHLGGDFFSTPQKRNQFLASTRYANFSWMMWQQYHNVSHSDQNQAIYLPLLAQMGYQFSITRYKTTVTKSNVNATITLKNTGNAPLYYNWKFALRLLDTDARVVIQKEFDINICNIMPGKQNTITLRLSNFELAAAESKSGSKNNERGEYTLSGGFINPLSAEFASAKPLYLANNNQQGDGFVHLSTLNK